MEIDQLRYFAAAAREEHFGRAAESLGISQPALSRCIARLEELYGIPLFERDGRGIRITEAGRTLLTRVDRIFAELEDARRELRDLARERRTRPVALGFLATLGLHVVPDAIRRYREREPDVEFRLLQGPGPLLGQRLVAGEIDLCLSSPRFADAAIEWQPLWEEELVVLVPRGHRLAARTEIDLTEIANEPVVALKPGYGLRQIVDELCRSAGFQPRIAFEGEEVATLRGLVGAGFGVSLVPLSAHLGDDPTVDLHVRAPVCSRTFGLSWLRGRYLPKQTTTFRDFIVTSLASTSARVPALY
ncbi:MAG TPA: LysR family transcriptional regulator [Candidatus Limnocylindria bacterium]|jgi:DNA-binding transcriptional LysR family regulator|nr:LysR family transcriptional regulator [Candidatus Limnocylindria bacterium]